MLAEGLRGVLLFGGSSLSIVRAISRVRPSNEASWLGVLADRSPGHRPSRRGELSDDAGQGKQRFAEVTQRSPRSPSAFFWTSHVLAFVAKQ